MYLGNEVHKAYTLVAIIDMAEEPVWPIVDL